MIFRLIEIFSLFWTFFKKYFASVLNAELTKLSTVDQVSVTRTTTADLQRGYTWTVTFLADTMLGDIPLYVKSL